MPDYGPHEFGPVDDCTRCIHCEALIGTTGPCTANTDREEPTDD